MTEKQTPIFNHLAIYVTDLQKSQQFYTQILGLLMVPDPFNDCKHLWLSMGNHTTLHIIEGASNTVSHLQSHHFCFSVSSITAFVVTLQQNDWPYVNSKGVPNSISTRGDGVQQIYFKDPDGYWIEINNALH